MNLFERIYRSCHQLPYADIVADNLWEHFLYCFKDPKQMRSMTCARGNEVGLPMNIIIDENVSYKAAGYSKRLFFQKDYNRRPDWNNCGEIDLNGNFLKSSMKNNEIKKDDLELLKTFVLNNKEVLSLICDGELVGADLYDKGIIIISNKPANPKEKQLQQEAVKLLMRRYEE